MISKTWDCSMNYLIVLTDVEERVTSESNMFSKL